MSPEVLVGTPLSVSGPEPKGRFSRSPTRAQTDAAHALGASADAMRPAAVGSDVFVYVERAEATLRFQLSAEGDIVGQTRFPRAVVRQGVAS